MFGMRLAAGGPADGSVVDTTPIAIDSMSDNRYGTAVAFSGGSFLVLWVGSSAGTPWVTGTWVREADAQVTSPSQSRDFAMTAPSAPHPVLAANSSGFLLAYGSAQYGPLRERLVPATPNSPAGSELTASLVANQESAPKVTFDGNQYFVAWTDNRAGGALGDIYGARIAKDGTVLDPNGIALCTDPADQAHVVVGFDPTYFYAVWEDKRSGSSIDLYGTRINKSTGARRFIMDFPPK